MGYDEATVERVRRVLAGRDDVVERRMIGGWSFLVGGTMCCGVTRGGLMVRVGSEARVGAEAREEALALAHVGPMELGGRALAGFVLVAPEGYASDEALAAWVRRGVAFAEGLAGKQVGAEKRGSARKRAGGEK